MHTKIRLAAKRLRAFSDRGATATEYAILVAFIAVVIVVGVGFFGQHLGAWYLAVTNQLSKLL